MHDQRRPTRGSGYEADGSVNDSGSCAVSWDGCVFVMVVRFTPSEVVSGIWTVCNHDVVRSSFSDHNIAT